MGKWLDDVSTTKVMRGTGWVHAYLWYNVYLCMPEIYTHTYMYIVYDISEYFSALHLWNDSLVVIVYPRYIPDNK